MKKPDLGQTITILANVGVIAGIVFLGVELAQNNEFLAAQARFNRQTLAAESWSIIATEPELTTVIIKDRNGQELTEVEKLRIEAYWMRMLTNVAWGFSELQGTSEIDVYIFNQRRNFTEQNYIRTVWQERSGAFDPAFVQFMEENVVN